MNNAIVHQLIKQENQLLDNNDSLDVLAELIDNEFIEIGSSGVVNHKAEVLRWLSSSHDIKHVGREFNAYSLADSIIMLTYISAIKDTFGACTKKAMRSSVWRLTDGLWRMVFHQGTPLK